MIIICILIENMINYNTQYCLGNNNFFQIETKKQKIVIGHTFNNNMQHINGWNNRLNKMYNKTAPFTIDKNGVIYKHFEPCFYSNILNNEKLDTESIVILLDNDGWLMKNEQKNLFFTTNWSIYSNIDNIFNKKWRGYEYWDSYTTDQINSLVDLVLSLCNEFKIDVNITDHNTKIDNSEYYYGILYRSNIDKNYTDLSPAFDFNGFRSKLITNI